MSVLAAPNQWTQGKEHETHGIMYDALQALPFDVVTLTLSMATTSVAGIGIPLPASMKFMGIAVVGTGTTIGITNINVCMGTVAEAGEAQPDNSEAGQAPPTPAANGNCLFSAAGAPSDQALTLVQNVPQTLMVAPPALDFIWPQGAYMTLRVVTNLTVSVGAQLKAVLLGKVYDPIPWRPSANANAGGGYALNPKYDIA